MLVRVASILFALLAAAAPPAQAPGGKPAGKPATDEATDPAVAADPTLGAELIAFKQWLQDYRNGAVRFTKEGRTDDAAVAALDQRMAHLADSNSMVAAHLLFDAAGIDPQPAANASTTQRIDFQRELQPWRVQALARHHLGRMPNPEIVPWLARMLTSKGIRQKGPNDDQRAAAVALRVLGSHPSFGARLELLKACRTMPTELRLPAVNALAQTADLELVPILLDLLHDPEPNVRIAAANALGTAMQPHVDESLGKAPVGELLAQRDAVIERLEALLVQDPIWQVRSACAFALAIQKCKPVIPALIHGLEAELARRKDPWAMDMRLHKLLEGLTGQKVVPGEIALWKAFWQKEGPTFAVRKKEDPGKPDDEAPKDSGGARYHKFFDLEIDSDRVLFVLDFSGSMAEPVHLKTGGTAVAGSEQTTTKAALVVQELKKLVMSLPDGALVNFVVFNDEVRTWRQEGDRPALVKLDDTTRDDLLGHFLDGLRPAGATNLYGALDAALGFGGRGLYDKYYAAGFDTLYVITDGAPTAGAVVDKDEIRRRVRETNLLRKIAIHCITFGDKNDTDFLGPLAEENGGRHVHVE
jgi:HEAT repeat protein